MNSVLVMEGGPLGNNPRVTVTDEAMSLPTALLTGSIKGAILTVEVASVRIAFGADPTVTPTQAGHLLEAGDALHLTSSALLHRLRVMNAASGETAILQITVLV